jgi:hypothetical protein
MFPSLLEAGAHTQKLYGQSAAAQHVNRLIYFNIEVHARYRSNTSICSVLLLVLVLLQVRSTPAFFLFQAGDLVCHFSGADSARLEAEVRRRIQLSADVPSSPIFRSADGDE